MSAPNGETRTPIDYDVDALLEKELGYHDYAVLRLEDAPGVRWRYSRLARSMPAVGSEVTVIQRPPTHQQEAGAQAT